MSDLSLNNHVVVTGTASGIGRAVATCYQERGFKVFGLDINPIDEEYPILPCDISDELSVLNAFSTIEQTWSSINYLVNCAGVFFCKKRSRIEETCLDNWEKVLKVNLSGTMLVTKKAIPLLKRARGDRAIVNVSSDQVVHPRQKNGAYAVSKSGIDVLTRLCAAELLEDRIRVNAVAPASVRTHFIMDLAGDENAMAEIYRNQNEIMPLGLIEPAEVAELIVFLGSTASNRITGQVISMDSGLYLKG